MGQLSLLRLGSEEMVILLPYEESTMGQKEHHIQSQKVPDRNVDFLSSQVCGKLGNLLNISEPPFTLPSNSHGYTQLKGLPEGLGLNYELGIACGTNPV